MLPREYQARVGYRIAYIQIALSVIRRRRHQKPESILQLEQQPEKTMRSVRLPNAPQLRHPSRALRATSLALLLCVALPQGAATAQDLQEKKNDACPSGFIINDTIDGNLTIKDRFCYVVDALITGKVTVTDSQYFVMIDSYVEGNVTIKGGCDTRLGCYSLMQGNEIVRSNVKVQKYEGRAVISNNVVRGKGNITIKTLDGYLMLAENVLDKGDLKCQGVDGDVVTIDNELRDGTDNCTIQQE
jgi:hypothetical protein